MPSPAVIGVSSESYRDEQSGRFGRVIVKVYAHRRGMSGADKIVQDELDASRGARRAFDEWMRTTEFSMSRAMALDASIDRLTIIATDVSGYVLVSIRSIQSPQTNLSLEGGE